MAQVNNTAGLFTLGEIASVVGAQCGIPRRLIALKGVVTDSREDCSGKLFVALTGENFNGHDYVYEAFGKGAAAAIVSEVPPKARPEWPLLAVEGTLCALADLAAWYRQKLNVPVVGITGSCGKTSTKELLAAALSAKYRVAKPAKSFNNIIGVSLTILSTKPEDQVLILELGTSAPGEIQALCEIGRPTIGIITNIGHSHLESLKSVEGVKEEKGSMLKFIGEGGVLVANIDCPECKELAEEFKGQAVTVAIKEQAQHQIEPVGEEPNGFVFKYDGIIANVPFNGTHNALNAGLAAATAEVLGVKTGRALRTMSGAQLPSMRLERTVTAGVLIINDAYNSNFESLKAALETLDRSTVPGRKILVCGDMLELGKAAVPLHKAIGWHIGRSSLDILVTVGVNAAYIAQEAHSSGMEVIFHRNTVKEVGTLLGNIAGSGDAVLFKASRAVHLERAVAMLRKTLADRHGSKKHIPRREPVGARN